MCPARARWFAQDVGGLLLRSVQTHSHLANDTVLAAVKQAQQ